MALGNAHPPRPYPVLIAAGGEGPGRVGCGEQVLQLCLQPGTHCGRISTTDSAQHQPVDVDVHAYHVHPRVSASENGFSRLAASRCAARSKWAMVTGEPASAARKVAFNAMLRIVPPATFRRASFP